MGFALRGRGDENGVASPELHQHLSEVLALEQLQKGHRRILDAVFDGFPPRELAFSYSPGHVFLELGQEIEVVRDDEALQSKALADRQYEIARSLGLPRNVVLRNHSAERTMADYANAQILQVLRRQVRRNSLVDFVLAEGRLISFEAEAPQPTLYVHSDSPSAGRRTSSFRPIDVSRYRSPPFLP
jgi:hypothetical protein